MLALEVRALLWTCDRKLSDCELNAYCQSFRNGIDLYGKGEHRGFQQTFSPILAPIEGSASEDVYDEFLERAAEAYSKALESLRREKEPYLWAQCHYMLGEAYARRSRGDSADNTETAINHLAEALTVYSLDDGRELWGETHHLLGTAYTERVVGDQKGNRRLAITHLSHAMTVFDRHTCPTKWAVIQSDLSLAHLQGNAEEDIELAIQCLYRALSELSASADPRLWAHAHQRLGLAFRYRVAGDNETNCEESIHHFGEALTVFAGDPFCSQRAMTELSLGEVCRVYRGGNREELQELALLVLTDALTYYQQDRFPLEWAAACREMAHVYVERMRGGQEGNLRKAIDYYQNSLQVFTSAYSPVRHRVISRELSNAQRLLEDRGEMGAERT